MNRRTVPVGPPSRPSVGMARRSEWLRGNSQGRNDNAATVGMAHGRNGSRSEWLRGNSQGRNDNAVTVGIAHGRNGSRSEWLTVGMAHGPDRCQ